MPTSTRIILYTDGSCKGNPGVGGWAFVALDSTETILKKDAAGAAHTTNNRMEMTAIIQGLNWIFAHFADLQTSEVEILSDSRLVLNTITQGWKRKANTDLWQKLDAAITQLADTGIKLIWTWVKGHAGNTYNEMVDQLAVQAAEKATGRNAHSPENQTTAKPSTPATVLPLEFAESTGLRDLLAENSFTCSSCTTVSPGVLSRKSPTSPIRVDCVACGKYIKFAKQK